ncbi:MAG: dipeptidase [Opitutales bacterium]
MRPPAFLHDGFFTLDAHIDTPTASLLRDAWEFGVRHDRAADRTQCDLPRMADGGIDALCFAVYVTQAARTAAGFTQAHETARRIIDRTLAVIAGHPDQCALALTASDGPRLKAAGRRALYLSLENSYSLGLDAGNVAKFHALGLRLLGLNHMLNNDLADSSTDPTGPEWNGLGPFGHEVVAECNRLGIILDASHASDDALRDLLEASRTPPILSHSGCRAVCDHPRNVGDDLLRDLARKGGVIHLNALPIAVVPVPEDGRYAALAALLLHLKDSELTPSVREEFSAEWDRLDRLYPNPRCSLDDYIRHLEHAVAVAGIDHVGIGCDFDGGGGVEGLDSVADYPNLTRALLDRGWSQTDLAKLWGGNFLRVLHACETQAAGK